MKSIKKIYKKYKHNKTVNVPLKDVIRDTYQNSIKLYDCDVSSKLLDMNEIYILFESRYDRKLYNHIKNNAGKITVGTLYHIIVYKKYGELRTYRARVDAEKLMKRISYLY
jgi:hypothetical protein